MKRIIINIRNEACEDEDALRMVALVVRTYPKASTTRGVRHPCAATSFVGGLWVYCTALHDKTWRFDVVREADA
jgi:hypothetical protein